MKLSIREIILLPVILILIAGIFTVSFIAYQHSSDALRESYFTSMNTTVSSLSKKIDDWIDERVGDLTITSQRAVVTDVFSSDFDNDSVRRANRELKRLLEAYKSFQAMGIIDKKGLVRAYTVEDQVNRLDLPDRPYFQRAMKGETVISEAVRSRVSGKVVFIVATPVITNGTIRGVVYATINLEDFSEHYLDPIKVAEKGYAYLVNTEGVVLAHPNKDNILKLDISNEDFFKQMKEKRQGRVEYEWNREKKVVTFSEIGKTKWIVAIGADNNDLFKAVYNIRNTSIIISFIAIFIASVVIFFLVSSISNGITNVARHAQLLSTGDFSEDLAQKYYKRKDELGVLALSFKKMTETIREMVQSILKSADSLVMASSEISKTSQSLSEAANEQAASVEETTSTLEEISATISQNDDNAQQTSNIAQKTAHQAREGGDAVEKTVIAMRDIVEKVAVIEDIAYQTNLLALNAAIEAARAGEHGRGFTVVSSEVRKLAEKSQNAAQEISELADKSVTISDTAGSLLKEIIPSIAETADLVQNISAASSQQTIGVNQINSGMEQLNEVTQSTASASEELASTSELMKVQATDLQDLLAFFKIKKK